MRRNNPTVLSLFDIEPFRIGGTEAYARELSSQLAERGWKSVLCFNNEPEGAVLEYLILANVQIEALRNPSKIGWPAIRGLAAILKRHRPRILHMQFTPLLSLYPWVARFFGVEQVFFTDQSSRPSDYVPQQAAPWKRLAARTIDWPVTKVICISDYVYRCLKARDLLPAQRLQRIYNAVDLSRAASAAGSGRCFRHTHSIPENRRLIVQVSWLIPVKGIADLLNSAKIVLSRAPNTHFAFVGNGAQREVFVEQANRMEIADHVTWTGVVTDPLGEGVFAAADIVCQVSRWQEGFGWTIAEAMSCSRPLIGTRVGGIPELVEDGITGFLVPPGEPTAIAEKILVLLGDAELRKNMGQAGREVAERKFDLKKNVREVINLYGIS